VSLRVLVALVAAKFCRSCGPGGSCNFFAGFGPIQDSAHSAGAGKHGEAIQVYRNGSKMVKASHVLGDEH
jgi:hypothetical protein